jgi:hypothetical protein
VTDTSLGGQAPVGEGSTVGVGVWLTTGADDVLDGSAEGDPLADPLVEALLEASADVLADVPALGLGEVEAPARSAAESAFGVPPPPPRTCSAVHSRSSATVSTTSLRRQ